VLLAIVSGTIVGLLIDAISDVQAIGNDELRPAPNFGEVLNSRFTEAIFRTPNGLVVVHNLDSLLAERDTCCELEAD
jgi:purine-binding chemotaxis protein CheW